MATTKTTTTATKVIIINNTQHNYAPDSFGGQHQTKWSDRLNNLPQFPLATLELEPCGPQEGRVSRRPKLEPASCRLSWRRLPIDCATRTERLRPQPSDGPTRRLELGPRDTSDMSSGHFSHMLRKRQTDQSKVPIPNNRSAHKQRHLTSGSAASLAAIAIVANNVGRQEQFGALD